MTLTIFWAKDFQNLSQLILFALDPASTKKSQFTSRIMFKILRMIFIYSLIVLWNNVTLKQRTKTTQENFEKKLHGACFLTKES